MKASCVNEDYFKSIFGNQCRAVHSVVTWPPSQAPLASTGPFSYSSRLVFTLHCSGPAAPPSQVCAALAEEARALGWLFSFPEPQPGLPGWVQLPRALASGRERKPEKVRRGQAAGTASPSEEGGRPSAVVRAPPPAAPPPTPPPSTAHEFAARTLQVKQRDPQLLSTTLRVGTAKSYLRPTALGPMHNQQDPKG